MREFTRLAEQGDAEAQFNLGAMYEHGRAVEKDEKDCPFIPQSG